MDGFFCTGYLDGIGYKVDKEQQSDVGVSFSLGRSHWFLLKNKAAMKVRAQTVKRFVLCGLEKRKVFSMIVQLKHNCRPNKYKKQGVFLLNQVVTFKERVKLRS